MDVAALIAKFPKSVWIGTLEFAVHFVPGAHEKLQDGADGLNGCAEFDPPEIYFCESLRLIKLMEIVRHELTHGVNYAGGIEDGIEEEDLCEKHGVLWTQFSIANPSFERWWMQACIAVRNEQSGRAKRKKKTVESAK